MFKALLKTLPSLSGNMKLGCFVDDYTKHNKTYTCKVKTAKLLPIAHTLFDKNIYVNLKNNAYEYDVKRFYKYYFDVFYKSRFSFSKLNTPIIDFSEYLYDCNEDFNYGCKRISYTKYDNQLAFFAPIYIESVDDLKGKYFKITCIFDKVNKLKKELIIDLFNNDDENYLADYLKRYAEKIDDKVIYMSSSYKNMYYGIDLLHGGFVRVEDNVSSNVYKKYYTINDFDAIVNYGFERNAMIMKQIIPLSFYFNPQNLLTNYEKTIYKDAKISIYGSWYTDDVEENFYNFSDNYNYYAESSYQLSSNNVFSFVNNSNNIMNYPYPAFNEASSSNYRYINTIIKTYNRWKLKYSDDEYPYIINNNFAFSVNQNSLYSYREFPLNYQSKNAICKMKNENYNMLFDLDDIYDESGKLINIKSEYYDMYNKNYIANFYNLLVKHDNDDTYDNIFDNDKYWGDVWPDNKIYYKGILYDLNVMYSKYKDMPKIDKFGIFINPEITTYITNSEYNVRYNNVKYTLHKNDLGNDLNKILTDTKIYSYEYINDNLAYITNNEVVYNDSCAVSDRCGDYVDINGYYIGEYEKTQDESILDNLHYNKNLYIDVNELLMFINMDCNNINIYEYLKRKFSIIQGYKIIDVKYKNNIVSELYKQLLELYSDNSLVFNVDNLICSENRFIENDEIYWAYDKLYFSIYPNTTKYKVLDNSELLNTLAYDDKIILYFYTDFILFDDLQKGFNEFILNYENDNEDVVNTVINNLNNINNKLNRYYVTNTLYDKNNKQSYSDICFVCLNNKENDYGKYILYKFNDNQNNLTDFHENVLYIDTFNLNHFYNKYFPDEPLNFVKVQDCYCNFLNIDHLYKYINNLYRDENYDNNSINETSIKDTIFIKIHLFNDVTYSEFNYINTTTKYIPISEYFNENLTINDYINYIEYDDRGYFYFNNNYYLDKLVNKNNYHIKNFELCFKKTMGIVNTQLYNLIMQLNARKLFKDLYLYRIYDNNDYKFEYVLNTIRTEDNINSIMNSNVVELYPYFNSIYVENKLNTKIYNDSFINNIIKCDNADVYKYNVYNIDYLTYMPKTDDDNLCAYRYSLYQKRNNDFINANDFFEKYFNINSNDNYSYYGYMLTFTSYDTTYGFYVLRNEFDNTSNTLNLVSENMNNINVVSYINDISINDIYNNQYTYLTKYYHNIVPYLNNINIVNELLNKVEPIIIPNKYTLTNIYKVASSKPDINNQIYSYDITLTKNKTNLQLLRYFDNIVPYLYKTDNVTSYYMYYKNTNDYIEKKIDDKNLSYILYQKSSSIYDEKVISYFNLGKDGKTETLSDIGLMINNYTPTEYKNFNNNKFYNLEQSFEVKLKSDNEENKYLFTKQEIEEIENNKSKIFGYFKEHMLSENNNLKDHDNDILFLYKKYDVKFSHIIKSFHKNRNNERDYDLYSLTIKYTLL